MLLAVVLAVVFSCTSPKEQKQTEQTPKEKVVIYQVLTRLFGNTNTTNKPWGTIGENGVGKFNDFTDKALSEIKDLGITHIWYTGVLHHTLITDYTQYGISNDDPDVVKGRAGSPYAIKDYYNVNPDLAVDPANRLQEFKALVERTHKAGMKVIIDIVPNHVARKYESISKPEGVADFGANDDTSVEYARDNNFYYVVGEAFKVPEPENGYKTLGGEANPLADGLFDENPAKWTGNGSRKAQPDFNDWYETVKINYGVKPDGTKDFDVLPDGYSDKPWQEHYAFWQDKDVPDSWEKYRDIVNYWLSFGVDGFRFDIAELVPVEFWSYLNSNIKQHNENAILIAEVYNTSLYRDYHYLGKMDYLYDKVQLYDSLKSIMQGHGSTSCIPAIMDTLADIEHQMLHFLENHDEQRIASPEFAGLAEAGKPAMVVSATISTSPIMIYFGQEIGEPAVEEPGFGAPSRTSIFDYIGVPHHQRWVNNGAFDGRQLLEEEKALRDFYKRLLNFCTSSQALLGEYQDIHMFNIKETAGYNQRVYSYVRWQGDEKLIVIANFDRSQFFEFGLKLPADVISKWELKDGEYTVSELLYGIKINKLVVGNTTGLIPVKIEPLESLIFRVD